jgi:soluble lytic murein transglycosylase-like protein
MKMGPMIGSKYMEQFGTDSDTYRLATANWDRFKASIQKADRIFEQSGISTDKLRSDVEATAAAFDVLGERVELSAKRIMGALLPLTQAVTERLAATTEGGALLLEHFMQREGPFKLDNAFGLGRGHWTTAPDIAEFASKLRQDNPGMPGREWERRVKAERERRRLTGVGKIPQRSATSSEPDSKEGLLRAIAAQYGLNPDLFVKQMRVESGLNPNAVSPQGAMGVAQLMPDTAKRFGVKDPYDFNESAAAGAKYMRWLLDRYGGDQSKAVGAYHMGEGGMDAALKGDRKIGPNTQAYVRAVLGEQARLGLMSQAPTSVVMNSEINVSGVSDPQRAADLVSAGQNNIARQAFRNAKGAAVE